MKPKTAAGVESSMSDASSPLVPRADVEKDLPVLEADYFLPEALELVRHIRNKDRLSDDEITMLALIAAQAALAKHVERGHATAEETIDTILAILDHEEVVQAVLRKLQRMIGVRVRRESGRPV